MPAISSDLQSLTKDPARLSTLLKGFEVNKDTKIIAGQPVIIKLDGNNFGKFTKGLKKPMDERFRQCLVETAKFLVKYWGASVGYVTSDEIIIVLENPICYKDINLASVPFSGKVSKLISLSAAKSSVYFNAVLAKYLPEKIADSLEDIPCLVSSVFSVPTMEWALLWLAWRQAEGFKNVLDLAMSCYYPHAQIEGKTTKQKIEALLTKGFNFDQQPLDLRYGVFVLKKKVQKAFSTEELNTMPPDKRPTGPVLRTVLEEIALEKLLDLENCSELLFNPLFPISQN